MPGHEVSDLGLIAENHRIGRDRDPFYAVQASALKDASQIRCPSRREDGDADAVSGCHPDGCLELKLNSKVVRMPEKPNAPERGRGLTEDFDAHAARLIRHHGEAGCVSAGPVKARHESSPYRTDPSRNTIGIVCVVALAARIARALTAMMISTSRATSSSAKEASCWTSPSAEQNSRRTL